MEKSVSKKKNVGNEESIKLKTKEWGNKGTKWDKNN